MAAIPYDVAEAFVHGKRASRGAFRSEGHAIFSYGLMLARWERDQSRPGYSVINIEHRLDGEDNISVTTARHIRALRDTLMRTYGCTRDDLTRGFRLAHGTVEAQR